MGPNIFHTRDHYTPAVVARTTYWVQCRFSGRDANGTSKKLLVPIQPIYGRSI